MKTYQEHDYWDDVNYLRWDYEKLSTSNLSNADLEAVCKLGLPTWVAPNINFELHECSDNYLQLGEDREDRAIKVSLKTGLVTVGPTDQYMNCNVYSMRKSLQFYAIMVEKAIEVNDEAIVKNIIDKKLISEFRLQMSALDEVAVLEGSFWAEEIKRLLN